MDRISTALKPQVATELFAFLKQHQALKQKVATLKTQITTKLDFSPQSGDYGKHVKQAEKIYTTFKPKTYDTSVALKNIESFEKIALERAEKTSKFVSDNLAQYKACLTDIKDALPVEELTVKDLEKAFPEIDDNVLEKAKKDEWYDEAYYSKFGSLRIF